MKDFLFCFVVLVVLPVYASEWDCASTSGTFDRSTDCTMSNEVGVYRDLTVTGKKWVYSTLTAASGTRHFHLLVGAPMLNLQWLNLTGGNVSLGSGLGGGSILVYNVAAHLNISHWFGAFPI